MRLVQFWDEGGQRRVDVAAEDGLTLQIITEFDSVYALALAADLASLGLKNI